MFERRVHQFHCIVRRDRKKLCNSIDMNVIRCIRSCVRWTIRPTLIEGRRFPDNFPSDPHPTKSFSLKNHKRQVITNWKQFIHKKSHEFLIKCNWYVMLFLLCIVMSAFSNLLDSWEKCVISILCSFVSLPQIFQSFF